MDTLFDKQMLVLQGVAFYALFTTIQSIQYLILKKWLFYNELSG
ncbi:hypothetical protein HMPREF0621_0443 [Pasteurella dagmatis ATCC 43325]|uniref:Uncharacterized protein n=1 Tax=Pasteurella dagmatis ATCC 43325 TaxID=667128 RepID=C9PN69_9PAST|nr:hypothetical protein HMPREF0621_0443 [Pasteurella dagmatis ATCC 43325]